MKKWLGLVIQQLNIVALPGILFLYCNRVNAQDIDAPDTLRFVKPQVFVLPSFANNKIIDTVIPGKCYLVEMPHKDHAATSVLALRQDKHFYAFDPFEGTIHDMVGWRNGDLL